MSSLHATREEVEREMHEHGFHEGETVDLWYSTDSDSTQVWRPAVIHIEKHNEGRFYLAAKCLCCDPPFILERPISTMRKITNA